MRLPQGLEKMRERSWQRVTPAQAAAIEKNWRKMSSRGLAIFVLMWGTGLFVWMAICMLFFSYLMHTLHVVRQPFYLWSVAPGMLLLSFGAPWIWYRMTRYNVGRLKHWKLTQTGS